MKQSKMWTGTLSAVLCVTLFSMSIAQAAYTTVKEAQAAATEKMRAKNYVGARVDLDEAMKLAKTDTEKISVLSTVARTYAGEKNYALARAEYGKIIALPNAKPGSILTAQISIGQAFTSEKNYEAARTELNKVLASKDATPTHKAQALNSSGLSYSAEKKYDLARAEYAKVLTLADARPQDKVAAQLNIALAYASEKNYPQARTEYQKVATMEGATDAQKEKADKQLKSIEGK